MADTTHLPPEAPGAAGEPAGSKEGQKSGLTAAMALITVGALALAPLFAALSRRPCQQGKHDWRDQGRNGCLHTIKAILVATLG